MNTMGSLDEFVFAALSASCSDLAGLRSNEHIAVNANADVAAYVAATLMG